MNWSRLWLVGEFTLDAPLRIAAGYGLAMDTKGQPIIPGSTFRGALRTYVESVLRGFNQRDEDRTVTLRGQDGRPVSVARKVALCCDSTDKRDDDLNYQGCLTPAIVAKWEVDPLLRSRLDSALVECTCQLCRLFGTAWLAGRVFVPDLSAVAWAGAEQARSGVALSRDRDVTIPGSLYQRSAIPAGARFTFRLVAENVTPAEQGMLMLGIRAFETGLINLGADRSRGFGGGHLSVDWWNCRYLDSTNLIGSMLGLEPQAFSKTDADAALKALAAHLGR